MTKQKYKKGKKGLKVYDRRTNQPLQESKEKKKQ